MHGQQIIKYVSVVWCLHLVLCVDGDRNDAVSEGDVMYWVTKGALQGT
jgi:hypothetical protein